MAAGSVSAWTLLGVLILITSGMEQKAPSSLPATEVEEVVTTFEEPGNGAGPLWCYGAPLLVRQGDTLFASVMETGAGVPLLCNTRWRLFRRNADGWKDVQQAADFREREPCPLVAPTAEHLLLSVNPSTEPPGAKYERCDPHLLAVTISHPERAPEIVRPAWNGAARKKFTDHSYRGIAADAARGAVLLLNIDAETRAQRWAYRDGAGVFRRAGEIRFPIRACYPQVALRDGAAHVMAIGDIVEPRQEWQAFKREKTGAAWDYVFRRLFYTWTPKVERTDFASPLEIDMVESTGGHLQNLDIWLDGRGAAHLLYLKTSHTAILRDRFFPGVKIATSLEHVVIRDGVVTARSTLVKGGEGFPETPRYGRFHATPDGTLYVVDCVRRQDPAGGAVLQNRLLQVLPAKPDAKPLPLALKEPFTTFFTATERGGSRPSVLLDLFGAGREGKSLRYARIRIR